MFAALATLSQLASRLPLHSDVDGEFFQAVSCTNDQPSPADLERGGGVLLEDSDTVFELNELTWSEVAPTELTYEERVETAVDTWTQWREYTNMDTFTTASQLLYGLSYATVDDRCYGRADHPCLQLAPKYCMDAHDLSHLPDDTLCWIHRDTAHTIVTQVWQEFVTCGLAYDEPTDLPSTVGVADSTNVHTIKSIAPVSAPTATVTSRIALHTSDPLISLPLNPTDSPPHEPASTTT